MAQDLKEIAKRVKAEHAASNLKGTEDTENDFPENATNCDFSTPHEEKKETTDITDGEGLAAKMNQMITNETDSEEDNEDESFEIEESETVVNPDPEDDDDDDMTMLIPDVPEYNEEDEESLLTQDLFEISNEEIQEAFDDIPPEDAVALYDNIRQRVENYRKDQILYRGVDPDVASEKAVKFMKEIAEEENIRYLKDHPNLCIVSVNKEDEKDLKFTPEEKEKMAKAKVIKLEVVETAELPVKKVRKVDKKNKISVIQGMDRYMSQYGVPLPTLNDFVTFKGAQLVEINNLRVDRDTSLLEITQKKANLIYRQLIGGANLQKFDPDGKGKLSFQDFLNKFPIHDMDIAVYGIMVASSMETMETDIVCDDCGKSYSFKYNLKTLLTMKGLSTDYKDRFEEILKNKTNVSHLQKMYDKNNQTSIVKSPITKNIYELNTPSIARAIRLYENLDLESEVDVYFYLIYQFIDKIWVYDNEKDDYIEIDEMEMNEMFTLIRSLPQTEINMIGNFVAPMTYEADFRLKSKCEHCGFKMSTKLHMNDLVFLATHGSPTEIRL